MARLLAAILVDRYCHTARAWAQEADTARAPADRSATGGAQTLEDIMAPATRRAEIDDSFRSDATGDPDSCSGIPPISWARWAARPTLSFGGLCGIGSANM